MLTTTSIPNSDERKLWRLAGSRCSFYVCDQELFKQEKEGVLGHMAHIVAEKENGPRGHSALTLAERNSYDNLILLCPIHHSLIDNSEEEWTVEKLHRMKQDHEDWVKRQLSKGGAWRAHICPGQIHYINLRRLLLDPTAYSYLSGWDGTFDFDGSKPLSEFPYDKYAQVITLAEHYLSMWTPPVLSLSEIGEGTEGARVKFETLFKTRNVPGPYKLESFKLKGDFRYDPHIYCTLNNRKIYFSINPFFITTDTAFGFLKSGQVKLSGLGIVNVVNEKEVRITPIILGAPDYPGSEYMVGRKFGEFRNIVF